MFTFSYDLLVAAGLLVITGLIVFLSRAGVLPRRSVPAAAGALLGGLTIMVWKEHQRREALERIKELKQEMAERDKRLEELREAFGATDRELARIRAATADQVRAAAGRIDDLLDEADERRRDVEGMTVEQIFTWAENTQW